MLNKERGFGYIEIIIGLLLLGIAAGVVYTYNSSIVRAERAERDRDTALQANTELMAETINLRALGERKDKLLAERQTQRNTADNIERAVNAKLAEIYRQSPQARGRRDQPVPVDVLRGLRSESAGTIDEDGKGTAAAKPAGTKSSR